MAANMATDISIDDHGLRKLARAQSTQFDILARELDEHVKNTKAARVVGGVIGAVGSIASVIGLIAIPFTAGASALVIGIGGGIIGAVGGLTAGGAKIARTIIEKSQMKDVQKDWSTFMEGLEKALRKKPAQLQVARDVLQANLTQLGLSTASVASNVGAAVIRTSTATESIAGAAGRVAAATVAGSVVLNVFLLSLSMYDIIDGSLELVGDDKSKTGNTIRKMAKNLANFAETGILQ